MNRERFQLALDLIKPTEWEVFEGLASDFLSPEFSSLRTMASQSGDRGRDALLFSPEDDPATLLQYSVTPFWESKIKATAQRINEEFPKSRFLIYVTNQQIGAMADDLRTELRRDNKLVLDIRDRSWFLERRNIDRARELAAEALAHKIVDPYLASGKAVNSKVQALNKIEARAAVLYLGMQWQDESRERGLTKFCFEALVRAVLRDSDSDHRMLRSDILKKVREILPNHSPKTVDTFSDIGEHKMSSA